MLHLHLRIHFTLLPLFYLRAHLNLPLEEVINSSLQLIIIALEILLYDLDELISLFPILLIIFTKYTIL